jgi:transposase
MVFVDSGYTGRCAQTGSQPREVDVQIIRDAANKNVGRWTHSEEPDLFTLHTSADCFAVLPKRWLVERTHAWTERAGRLAMHHDRLNSVSKAWVCLAEARMLPRRLTT